MLRVTHPIFWASMAGLVALAEGASLGWNLLSNQPRAESVLRLQIPNRLQEHYRPVEIHPSQVGDLEFDGGERFFCGIRGGGAMEILTLWYEEGNSSLTHDVHLHDPAVCMGRAGNEIEEVYEDTRIPLNRPGAGDLRVRMLRFSRGTYGEGYLFKAVWYPEGRDLLPPIESRWTRFNRAFGMQPLPPALILMASIQGARDRDHAQEIFEKAVVAHVDLIPVEEREG